MKWDIKYKIIIINYHITDEHKEVLSLDIFFSRCEFCNSGSVCLGGEGGRERICIFNPLPNTKFQIPCSHILMLSVCVCGGGTILPPWIHCNEAVTNCICYYYSHNVAWNFAPQAGGISQNAGENPESTVYTVFKLSLNTCISMSLYS